MIGVRGFDEAFLEANDRIIAHRRGVVGLIISLAGLFIGLPALSAVEETVKSRVADLDQALITAADGLTVADTSLASATETITAIENDHPQFRAGNQRYIADD